MRKLNIITCILVASAFVALAVYFVSQSVNTDANNERLENPDLPQGIITDAPVRDLPNMGAGWQRDPIAVQRMIDEQFNGSAEQMLDFYRESSAPEWYAELLNTLERMGAIEQ